jgi:phenylalanyl-tRNA synthetase alpha chain
MKEQLDNMRAAAVAAVAAAGDEAAVEAVRLQYLGRKGELTGVLRGMAGVSPDERPAIGALVNRVKDDIDAAIVAGLARTRAAERSRRVESERLDVTAPGRRPVLGRAHPLTQVSAELIDAFVGLGFRLAEGPEIEDDYHNFGALNFPPDHPARDMQDTLFVEGGSVMRTHTSPVQIRVMETHRPPLQVITAGATYRHDSDATHSPMFHQIEGFMVDRGINFGDLKGVLTHGVREVFGADRAVRLRPSFFPFTEPSAELDIGCFGCGGRGGACRLCRGTGWIEVLGAGMIDPNVFRAVGYDPEEVSGFAFGIGVERIAMLKYQVDDIRRFFANDLRFIEQF